MVTAMSGDNVYSLCGKKITDPLTELPLVFNGITLALGSTYIETDGNTDIWILELQEDSETLIWRKWA